MGYIAADDLIANMTPEQKILVLSFYAQFNNRSAANKQIVNVEPLLFIGAVAATEFLIYSAQKLYLCFSIAGDNLDAASTAINRISLYNELNTQSRNINNNLITYNTTTLAVNYFGSTCKEKNIYFSRINTVGYIHISFNGYRITLI